MNAAGVKIMALVAALLAAAAGANASTITGTIKKPDGSLVNGRIEFTLSQPTTLPSPSTLFVPPPVYCLITLGAIQTSPACTVQDNASILPAGTTYVVRILDSNNRVLMAGQRYTIPAGTVDFPSLPVTSGLTLVPPTGSVTGNFSATGGGTFGGNLSVGGNLTLTGTCTGCTDATAAIKPASADAIQFATLEGNDSNDGLSWGKAKKSLIGAAWALPNGNPGTATVGGGTIYYSDLVLAHPTAGCGFMVLTDQDPNYASPPACWSKANTVAAGVTIIGVGATNSYGPNAHRKQAGIVGGTSGDRNKPLFWFSGSHFFSNSFYNVGAATNAGRMFVIGECSNGVRDGTCSSGGGFYLDNVGGIPTQAANMGPCIDVVGGFWIWLNHVGCDGTESQNGSTSDRAPAILFDGSAMTGFTSQAILFIADCNLANGGIKFKPASGNNSLDVNRCTEEASSMPLLWLTEYSAGGIRGNYSIRGSQTADSISATYPLLQVDGYGAPGAVVADSNVADGARAVQSGPLISTGQSLGPAARQAGFTSGATGVMPAVVAQHSGAAWYGGLVAVKKTNSAQTAPTSWSTSGCSSCTVTDGQTNPYGSTASGAAQVSTTAGGVQKIIFSNGTLNGTIAVGGRITLRAWVKFTPPNTNGYILDVNLGGGSTFTETGTAQINVLSTTPLAGGWALAYGTGKISAVSSPNVLFRGAIDSAHAATFYEPTLSYDAPGTDDNENAEYAMNGPTWPNGAAIGTVVPHTGASLTATLVGNASTASTIPQQMVYDNFNRANGGLGSNWTTVSGETAPTITSNQVLGNAASYQMAFYSALTVQADQFAEATATVGGADGTHTFGLLLRGSGNRTYVLDFLNGTAYILRRTAGSNTTVTSVASTPAAGAVIRFEVSGTTFTGYVNGSSILSGTDSTYATGQPGIEVFGSTGLAALDGWSGGNLTAIPSVNVEADWTQPQHFLGGLAVGKSMDPNGSGFKHGRVTTGSIATVTRADVTLSWTTAFPDTNYSPSCTVIETSASGTGLRVERIRTVNAGSIVVQVMNDSGGSLTGTLSCHAAHD